MQAGPRAVRRKITAGQQVLPPMLAVQLCLLCAIGARMRGWAGLPTSLMGEKALVRAARSGLAAGATRSRCADAANPKTDYKKRFLKE
jgi:hypothetical protein